jgi:hypothetical protein
MKKIMLHVHDTFTDMIPYGIAYGMNTSTAVLAPQGMQHEYTNGINERLAGSQPRCIIID